MGGQADKAAQILDEAHRVTAKTDAEGNVLVHTYQDVEPHLKYAAEKRKADWYNRGQFGKRPDFHHTMSVPFNVMTAVAQRLGIQPGQIFDKENSRRIMAELKRTEFAGFRTTIDKRI